MKRLSFIIIPLLILIVFVSGCIQQETDKIPYNSPKDFSWTPKEVWGVKSWTTITERPGTDNPHTVLQTSDGGYVISGITNNGTKDCYVSKILGFTFLEKVGQDGKKIWEKSGYKGGIVSLQETPDGGFVATGTTAGPTTGFDIYLVKTDALGNIEWEKNHGGMYGERGFSVQQTSDGGYIIAAGTGSGDINLLKTDGNGGELWSKIFAKDMTDVVPHFVQETSDGGYIVIGRRMSRGAPRVEETNDDPYIDDDVYLLRTDSLGSEIWEKTIDAFGKHADEMIIRDALQTPDGGYVVVGGSIPIIRSNGTLQSSSAHIFMLKIDSDGNKAWAQEYGMGIGHSVKMSDEGYIISAEAIDNMGPNYLVKIGTDAEGNKLWEKPIEILSTYRGGDHLELVKQTSDKSYIVLGTREFGDLVGYAGMLESDTLLMKIEETDKLRMPDYEMKPPRETILSVKVEQLASNGNGWIKTVGGSLGSKAQSVQKTSDGGYVIAGWTHFNATMPSGITVPPGARSTVRGAYLAKTDANGNLVWEKSFEGEVLESVQEAPDGGYVVLGTLEGLANLIKTDTNGNVLWNRTLSKNLNDALYSLRSVSEGGYILVGTTSGHGATLCEDYPQAIGFNSKIPNSASADVYIVKTDANGNILWEKAIGGARFDVGNYVQETSDGGYIITGITTSFSERGVEDVYLLKIDRQGNRLWEKAIGGNKSEIGYSVQQTSDGGYIIAGLTVFTIIAEDRGEGGYARQSDVYLIKTDNNGNILWEKTFGGNTQDRGFSVEQTSDSGYIATGETDGYLYLLKTDAKGNIIWEKAFESEEGTKPFIGRYVHQTNDGGYVVVANTFHTSRPEYQPIYLIKTDGNGNI